MTRFIIYRRHRDYSKDSLLPSLSSLLYQRLTLNKVEGSAYIISDSQKTKETMKQTEQMVPVEDFNIDTLREAFLQGRLYVQTTTVSETYTREKSIQAIMHYVSHIDTCASASYRLSIPTLWERILRSPELGNSFFLSRYSSRRNQPNWYRVNATVATLLELNVYCKSRYTAIQLHLMMEQTTKRTNHYNGMNRYLLEHTEITILKQLLQQ